MNSLLAWACLSAELSWLTLPAARKHFMETNIWCLVKHNISPKTARALKTVFFAMAANRISPNQITTKVNQRSPTFHCTLQGIILTLRGVLECLGKNVFLITQNSRGAEGNL